MFYEWLYFDRNLGNCEILDMVENILTLTLQEKLSLEGEITSDEATLALKNKKENKKKILVWMVSLLIFLFLFLNSFGYS